MTELKSSVATSYVLGVDLGQAQDPTAIAVAEARTPNIHIRHLERLRLGTPYPQVIDRIGVLARALPFSRIVVDATGVGRAVLDHMAHLEPVAVAITAGRQTSYDGRMWRVPKMALLRPLVSATEIGRLKVAKRAEPGGGLSMRTTGLPAADYGARKQRIPGCRRARRPGDRGGADVLVVGEPRSIRDVRFSIQNRTLGCGPKNVCL